MPFSSLRLTFAFVLVCFFAASTGNCCAKLQEIPADQTSGKDTLNIDFERYSPILKAKMYENMSRARKFSNFSLIAFALVLTTFGLTFLIGIGLSIIALYYVAKVRKLQIEFPELEDDPELVRSIRNCYLRFGLASIGLVGIPLVTAILIVALIPASTATSFVLATAILAIALFFLLDWLVFRIKNKMN